MEMLGWLSNDFSSAVGSYRKIRKVYDQKPSIQEPEEPIVLPEVTGDIRFEHVSFHKEDQHEILHDIHFHVEAGKTIGIMGATGSGKTSLIQLLCRLYDATGGTIYLDNGISANSACASCAAVFPPSCRTSFCSRIQFRKTLCSVRKET